MPNYQIITDSACDLPVQKLEELNVKCAHLSLLFRGQTLPDSVSDDIAEMYRALRHGEEAKTSAVNPEGWISVMEPALEAGQDVLALCFSSGLSTTYQSAVIAAQELRERHPQRQINVVDTLCASLGQGLLVHHACRMRDRGMTMTELTDWVETHKLNLCHWFTVDDLMYLKRGGRISTATAILGTMLGIKPVMHMDDTGHLVSVSKARGRRASIQAIVEQMQKLGLPGENRTVFICHGDSLDDARYMEQLVRERLGVEEVFIGYTGAVIGSHSGPGTLSLFFLGQHR